MARKIISKYSAQWRALILRIIRSPLSITFECSRFYIYTKQTIRRVPVIRVVRYWRDARKRSILNGRKTLVLCTNNNNNIFRKQTFRSVSNLYERVNLRLEKSACEYYFGRATHYTYTHDDEQLFLLKKYRSVEYSVRGKEKPSICPGILLGKIKFVNYSTSANGGKNRWKNSFWTSAKSVGRHLFAVRCASGKHFCRTYVPSCPCRGVKNLWPGLRVRANRVMTDRVWINIPQHGYCTRHNRCPAWGR